jgi:cytochrome c-type biogenesis protein CcmH/NrfG
VYNRQQKAREASEEFQQTVNLEPNNSEARYFLGTAKIQNGDRKGAMEQYDYLKRLNPKAADDLNKRLNP